MGISTPHKHLLLVLRWYSLTEPRAIVIAYLRYARALQEVIPFVFLIATLFSPWKNIHDVKRGHGFDLNEFIERLVMNVFSRVVGAVVRMLTIAFGVIAQILLLAAFLTYFAFWIAYPIAAIVGVGYAIWSL